MNEERLKALRQKGIEMMAQGYTCAETALQVLRETMGWDAVPYQWSAAGYMGAIDSGRTTCGLLFGGSIFLGYLAGARADGEPTLENEDRAKAIASVKGLFQGFVERFGTTDCRMLTGCDFSQKADVKRYFSEKIYENTCFRQFDYVLRLCLMLLETRGETA
jgi:hypothetical protein